MTNIKKITSVVALAIVVYLVGLTLEHYVVKPTPQTHQNKPPATLNATDPLFAATLNDTENRPIALKSYKGRLLVINFWATWCPPCREEMPELSALSKELAAKNIAVIGIAVDDAESIKSFQKETPVAYPLLEAEVEGAPLATGLGNDKGVLPFTVLIDQKGQVIKRFFGKISKEQLLVALASQSQ